MSISTLISRAIDAKTDTLTPISQNEIEACGIRNVVLRDYQLYGVSWLRSCVSRGHACLLCDEMGLGKTLQVITFISTWLKGKSNVKILLVSPLSVLENWSTELRSFSPSIGFLCYVGSRCIREELRTTFRRTSTPVLLTTYELCINDEDFLKTVDWDIIVVDEGHRLKNSETLLYRILCECRCKLRFILTGTPVQNDLIELYNLLHFVAPDYFQMHMRDLFIKHFKSTDLIDDEKRSEELSRVIQPFLLRRTKQQVSLDLPPRLDLILYHQLTPLQTKIYQALLTRDAGVLSAVVTKESGTQVQSFRLLNLLIQLRKCVNHPYLFDGVEPEPFELGQHLIEASGKLILLDRLLDFLYNPFKKENRNQSNRPVHKVLIFSQMTRMLDIVQDYLTLKDYPCERLDGSVRGDDRVSAVKDFSHTPDCFVFLLSTKAGGQGLNLTAADTVILVDSDFNPQNDIQAAARVHRIGQSRPVRIIRLVGRNTVEEAILARADSKLKLTARVLCNPEINQNSTLDIQDLESVLKFGLSSLLDQVRLNEEAPNGGTPSTNSLTNVDFTEILGDTDPETGHWRQPILGESSKSDNWIAMTDQPYQCEVSPADLEAVAQLKRSHDEQIEREQVASASSDGLHTRAKGPITGFAPVLQRRAVTEKKPLTAEELAERVRKAADAAEAKRQKVKELTEKRAMRKLEKKRALWQSTGYVSLSVFRDESSNDRMTTSELNLSSVDEDTIEESGRSPPGIHYVVGDASEPLAPSTLDSGSSTYPLPAFVCLSVDDSGYWPRGGFFGALSKRSPKAQKYYELAAEMNDLKLGDCHVIPIQPPTSDDQVPEVKSFSELVDQGLSDDVNFCGLLVAQQHTRRSHRAGQPPELHLGALERSLFALSLACQAVEHCSVHVPHLGHGTHAFQWYTVERLLRKYLVERSHVPVFVYYYRRPVSQITGQDGASQQCTERDQSADHSDQPPVKQARTHLTSRHLKNLFSGKVFYLYTETDSSVTEAVSSDDQVKALKRLIIAYDGDVALDLDSSVTHVIIMGPRRPLDLSCDPDHHFYVVTSAWIHDSVRHMRCQAESSYSG